MNDSTTDPQRPAGRPWRAAVIVVCCGLYLCGLTLADPDLWGHTLYGLRALESGVLTEQTDPFSYTVPGATWVNHEWLTELEFGWLWGEFGNAGLWWWRNAVVALLLYVAWREGRRRDASEAGLVAVFVPTAICLSQFVCFIRPQLATYVLLAVMLVVLRRHSQNPNRIGGLLWLPPLMILWTNQHGGFLAGLGLVFVAGVDLARRAWLKELAWKRVAVFGAIAAACGLATLVTPYGIGLHRMLWYHLGTEQIVSEWRPVWATRLAAAYFVPFVLPVLALVGTGRRPRMFDVLVFGVIGFQAAMHLKHVALLCVACLVLLPAPMSAAIRNAFPALREQWTRRGTRWLGHLATGGMVVILLAFQLQSTLPMLRAGLRPWDVAVSTRGYVPGVPLRAVDFMKRAGIGGNLVTDYGWAQFAIWQLHPESRIAFDGRYRTVYPPDLERDYVSFVAASPDETRGLPLIDEYETDVVLLSTTRRNVVEYLRKRADWSVVYEDEQAVLFLPRERAATLDPSDEPVELPDWAVFPGGRPDESSPPVNTRVTQR